MSANLLEQPPEMEGAHQACKSEPACPGAAKTRVRLAQQTVFETVKQDLATANPTKTLRSKIFQGHKEFLGWTPD